MIDFKELVNYKKSNIGIFLGCGQSINDITKEQWDIIDKHDVWTLNDFLYHWYVPDFYHVELKSQEYGWNELWRQRKLAKGSSYNNVKFIVNKDHCDHILPAISEHPMIFGYPRVVVRKNVDCVHVPNMATHSNNASFTLVLDLLSKMNYEKVILFGVDMKHSRYFWTDTDKYGNTHCNTNNNLPKNKPHATATRVLNFVLNVADKWFDNELYIGYKESLLYDKKLPYMNMKDI